jgi:hypothetical protein
MKRMAMTARAVVCAALTVGMASITACSSDQASDARNVGSVSIPLSTNVGTSSYRLDAVFTITGEQSVITLKTQGDEPVLSTTLPTGAYDISLDSFTLSKADDTGAFHAVSATVVANSLHFTVTAHATTTVTFQFLTDGVIVAPGTGNVDINFGVTETGCNPISVDPAARTVQSARFFLDFSNAVAGNPEELDVLRWAGGPNLTQSYAVDACSSNLVEHFGNSWAGIDPTIGGPVLVGSGSTGSWEQDGASIVVHSTSSGCTQSFTVPVETRYRFRQGIGENTIEIERQFELGRPALPRPFRPFIPRLVIDFDRVLHPNAAGTSLLAEDVLPCPYGCELSDWDGSWFAYYASSGPFAGQGVITLRQPSTIPAHLFVDSDIGVTYTNASAALLLPPPDGFPPELTETELLCFFDAETWTPAEQAALTLPAGCTFDLACNASE